MAKLKNAAKSIADGSDAAPEWSDAVDDLRQRSDSTMLCLQEIRAELREARRHREALEASRVVAEAYHAELKVVVFDMQRQLTPISPMLHGSGILPNPNLLGCDVELAGGNSCGSLEEQDGSRVLGGGDRTRLKDWLNCGGDTSDLADFNMSQIHTHKVFVEMSDSNTCSTPSLNCMPKQAIATTSTTSVASSPLDARLHVAAAPRDALSSKLHSPIMHPTSGGSSFSVVAPIVGKYLLNPPTNVFKQDINICGGVEVECKGIEEEDATSSECKVNKVVEVSGGNGGRFERVGIGVVCDADRLSGDMFRRTRIGVVCDANGFNCDRFRRTGIGVVCDEIRVNGDRFSRTGIGVECDAIGVNGDKFSRTGIDDCSDASSRNVAYLDAHKVFSDMLCYISETKAWRRVVIMESVQFLNEIKYNGVVSIAVEIPWDRKKRKKKISLVYIVSEMPLKKTMLVVHVVNGDNEVKIYEPPVIT